MFIEAKDDGSGGDNQTTGAISRAKLQSNLTTNKLTSSFLQVGCPSCRPTNSVKALKGKISHSMGLLTPNSPGGLSTLSLTTNSSCLPWGRVAMPLISPLMPVPQLLTWNITWNSVCSVPSYSSHSQTNGQTRTHIINNSHR